MDASFPSTVGMLPFFGNFNQQKQPPVAMPVSTMLQQDLGKLPQPEVTLCRVCDAPASKIRCGVIACEACKKFFLRNRDNLAEMQCVTNRGDCVIGAPLNSPAKRSICSRCRLAKCLQVGMRIKGNVYTKPRATRTNTAKQRPISNSKSTTTSVVVASNKDAAKVRHPSEVEEIIEEVDLTSSSSSSSFLSTNSSSLSGQRSRGQHEPLAVCLASSTGKAERPPQDWNILLIHEALKTVVSAAAELSAFQSLPWAIRREVIKTDAAMWSLTMECFDFAVISAFSFIKQLPGFDEIPLADRCHLFAGSFIPLIIGQVTLPGSYGAAFFGQNDYNHDVFFRCFPNFLNLEANINAAAAAMKAWNPSYVEFAICQALLFYQTDTLSQLERPDLVMKMNQRLKQALRSFYETNKECYLNIHSFYRVFSLLRQVETVYDVDMYQFANSRPDLIHKNRLFAEMFFLPAEGRRERWYQMNLNSLEDRR